MVTTPSTGTNSRGFNKNSYLPHCLPKSTCGNSWPTVAAWATFGQPAASHSSVLTERPSVSWDNLSRDAYLLWFWVGVVLAVALVSWLVWDRRVQSKPSSPAPDPVRDQEWCHYPQPGDARSDKAKGARDG